MSHSTTTAGYPALVIPDRPTRVSKKEWALIRQAFFTAYDAGYDAAGCATKAICVEVARTIRESERYFCDVLFYSHTSPTDEFLGLSGKIKKDD